MTSQKDANDSSETNPKVRAREQILIFALDTVKFLGPAIVALVLMWAKVDALCVAITEGHVREQRTQERLRDLELKTVVMDASATSGFKEVLNVVRRVEEDVKELKADMKSRLTSGARP